MDAVSLDMASPCCAEMDSAVDLRNAEVEIVQPCTGIPLDEGVDDVGRGTYRFLSALSSHNPEIVLKYRS